MQNKICVFAGTSDGRELVEFLKDYPFDITVCVASKYGEDLIETKGVNIIAKRMDKEEMLSFFIENKFTKIIDCTHPYAEIVTENIVWAAKSSCIEYLRINRECDEIENILEICDTKAVAKYLKDTSGNIMLTIGAKELPVFKDCDYKDRLYVRILPFQESLEIANDAGILPSHIIAMQGPFTKELNKAMFTSFNIKIMVTKNSGDRGNYLEKIEAANESGIQSVVIKQPEQIKGFSLESAKNYLTSEYNKVKQNIYIIGTGVGELSQLTQEAREAIEKADLIIGAKRLSDVFNIKNKPVINEYLSDKVIKVINDNNQYKNIAVIFSGDVGFYSGAKSLYEKLKDANVYTVCGISSPIYLCSKIKMPWQDMKLVSLHGRENNIINAILTNEKVFTLLDRKMNVQKLCEKLIDYKFEDVKLYIGENLSFENEKIHCGTPKELITREFSDLSSAVIINENFNNTLKIGISDTEFKRVEKVPMTKSEIRAIIISKLQLSKNSVCYDIGAGTGSVSIEMALNSPNGKVYVVEKNKYALDAIAENITNFKVDNISTIHAYAPEGLEDVESPTHVFIGGSSGNLMDIIDTCLIKNKNTRFVVSAVTLDSIAEISNIIKRFKNKDVVQVSSSKLNEVAGFNFMIANNPIYIASFDSLVEEA